VKREINIQSDDNISWTQDRESLHTSCGGGSVLFFLFDCIHPFIRPVVSVSYVWDIHKKSNTYALDE
jgi:hypothetical protein